MIVIPYKYFSLFKKTKDNCKNYVAPGCMLKLMVDNWQIIGQVFSDICL